MTKKKPRLTEEEVDDAIGIFRKETRERVIRAAMAVMADEEPESDDEASPPQSSHSDEEMPPGWHMLPTPKATTQYVMNQAQNERQPAGPPNLDEGAEVFRIAQSTKPADRSPDLMTSYFVLMAAFSDAGAKLWRTDVLYGGLRPCLVDFLSVPGGWNAIVLHDDRHLLEVHLEVGINDTEAWLESIKKSREK